MYTVILFTTTNNMLFLYVFPMIVVISVYNDKAYALKVNIGVVIENLLVVILGATTGRFGFRDMSSGVIQILAVLCSARIPISQRRLPRRTAGRSCSR